VLWGAIFLSRVIVTTTLGASARLVFVRLRIVALSLNTLRHTGSLTLVFAFRDFRIAIFISILWWFLLSGCMYF
jgi:hypothetical protein